MKIDRYTLETAPTGETFEFVSYGPKGGIHKLIQFQKTDEPGLFNLAFGDKDPDTGEIDDMNISDNGDMEKVIATVVGAVYLFCDVNPAALIYFSGSTKARTRLYRIGITKYTSEIMRDFYLFGRKETTFTAFRAGQEYTGFLAQRKLA